MKYDLTASIVTCRNDPAILQKAINSFLNTELSVRLIVIDNSPDDNLRQICNDNRIEYVFNNANIGFGAGHNIAIRRIQELSKYHLVLNPDIYFSRGNLEKLYNFIESNNDVGLVMPKILYPDGSLQYLCKKLPTPFDLILRRFIPSFLKPLFRKRLDSFEFKDRDYNEIMSVPGLSGCFMFIRTGIFKEIGMFDERFFMYAEDTDLCRRIGNKYKTMYYPEAVIYHEYAKGSYKSNKLLMVHINSAIKYFNKWGWFFDKDRNK
ncbi:MAG: glycosyltransferase family 2 protein [Candidatus Methanoperedens sp.]|nr:glycosyltransferase family 2 protein [Candidatus Methanoperedens sp.]